MSVNNSINRLIRTVGLTHFSIPIPFRYTKRQQTPETHIKREADDGQGQVLCLNSSTETETPTEKSKLDDGLILIEYDQNESSANNAKAPAKDLSKENDKSNQNNNNHKSNNNHHENASGPMLTIASVTSLSMDNTLLVEQSNIIISDDEEFVFDSDL